MNSPNSCPGLSKEPSVEFAATKTPSKGALIE